MSKYKGYNDKYKEATIRYMKSKRESLSMNFPKGTKERYKRYAASKGTSLTKLFTVLIENAMRMDGFKK